MSIESTIDLIKTYGFELMGNKLIFRSMAERDSCAEEHSEESDSKPRFFEGKMLRSQFDSLPEFEGY